MAPEVQNIQVEHKRLSESKTTCSKKP